MDPGNPPHVVSAVDNNPPWTPIPRNRCFRTRRAIPAAAPGLAISDLTGVGFDELWPLFAGLILSIALALRFFLGSGADGSHWLAKTLVAAIPFGAGFGYLRFMESRAGRRDFKGDLWENARRLEGPDWSGPAPSSPAPVVPRIISTRPQTRGRRAPRPSFTPGARRLPAARTAERIAMSRTFPAGWLERDMLWWGSTLDARTCLSRGRAVEVPDLRSADNRTILDLRRQNAHLLGVIGATASLQVHWTVEDDFEAALDAYSARKQAGLAGGAEVTCAVRRAFYEQRPAEGSLRREKGPRHSGRRAARD